MNSISEITAQNLQDCWSILYKNVAKSMLRERGRDGETVVRRANHLCGVTIGKLERASQISEGRLANLETLFAFPSVLYPDPRFRVEWQLFNEQEAVFDVVTCPIYDKLKETGDQKLMLPFCEEYHHGCIMGYTENAGQCCLSENFVYPGENSCRLGCYFRASNVGSDVRPACFDEDLSEKTVPAKNQISGIDPKKAFSLWAQVLIESYIEECTKRYGAESVCIISSGLRAAAHETAGYILYRSWCTNQKPDESYLSDNTFWGLGIDESSAGISDLGSLIQINYSSILKQDLGF